MRTSDTLTALAPALVKAIAEIKGAPKDRKNPHFKNDYATLESVIEASREILASHGLCSLQALGAIEGGALHVTTRIQHESGEFMESLFQMPVGKLDPQSTGSASTYARRYALMAALNMAPIDDDGEGANAAGPADTSRAKPPERSQPLQVAINTMEGYQRDTAAFREFWEKNKAGFKANFSPDEYAEVVGAMKRIAASMPKPEAAPETPPGEPATRTHLRNGTPVPEGVKSARELISQDEIPW